MAEEIAFEFEFRNQRYRSAEQGLRAFAASLNKAPERMAPALKRELRTFLDGVSRAMQQRHGNPWPGGTGPKTLSRRSGRALQSIAQSIDVRGSTLADIQGSIGGVGYLRTHEYGATIRAKRAKYLTIPLPPALNPDGTPKKRSARDWHDTFVITSKAGNLLIVQKRAGRIVPLYVLKKEVTIPARLGMRDTLQAGLPLFVDRAMSRMAREAIDA